MCIWSGGWTRISSTLDMTVHREQQIATGLVEPRGNAPGKLTMQFSNSLLCLESFNKCFVILPVHISILSQRNRREQGRAPGKSGRKVFRMSSTSVWCFQTHICPSTHCWPLPAPLSLARSSTCSSDLTNGSGDTSSNLKWGVTFTSSF